MSNLTETGGHRNPDATLAMRRAWILVGEGWAIYGGPKRSFMAAALRIAWAELKADPVAQACRRMVAELRADRLRREQAPGLSPGCRAAATRRARRHGAPAYGNDYASARFTAGW
ncbi:MAG: hypothetical protein ACLQME_12585 [Alphaproteobacteria bacterium]